MPQLAGSPQAQACFLRSAPLAALRSSTRAVLRYGTDGRSGRSRSGCCAAFSSFGGRVEAPPSAKASKGLVAESAPGGKTKVWGRRPAALGRRSQGRLALRRTAGTYSPFGTGLQPATRATAASVPDVDALKCRTAPTSSPSPTRVARREGRSRNISMRRGGPGAACGLTARSDLTVVTLCPLAALSPLNAPVATGEQPLSSRRAYQPRPILAPLVARSSCLAEAQGEAQKALGQQKSGPHAASVLWPPIPVARLSQVLAPLPNVAPRGQANGC
ncbi:hypothetical protein BDY21DRAFT_361620 [Lineolata rhizophorae]|uniref:Uncharacterized protein n=1 Tax=Lineolata rhizophorae TaxID=578093 RepID=A0A6A6P6S5_9PEZI|nr:hypothetical protein BDY21DRAFT_361620 [Lineolata rhizophorae]